MPLHLSSEVVGSSAPAGASEASLHRLTAINAGYELPLCGSL